MQISQDTCLWSADDPVNGIINELKYSEDPLLSRVNWTEQVTVGTVLCGCFNKWFERRSCIEYAVHFSSVTQ